MSGTTIIKNKETGAEYPVSSEQWEKMIKLGKSKVFTVVKVVEHRPLKVIEKKEPIVPPEVKAITDKKSGPSVGAKSTDK
jgi:hypothetical protein